MTFNVCIQKFSGTVKSSQHERWSVSDSSESLISTSMHNKIAPPAGTSHAAPARAITPASARS